MKERKHRKVVAIIVPAYNEDTNIKELIEKIFKFLPDARIVVVDDSPNDLTLDKIRLLKQKYKHLEILSRKIKGGRGTAVIDGIKYAQKKYNPDMYIEMDADLSHDPSELPNIVSESDTQNVVLASRYLAKSQIVDWPITRRITSKLSNLLIGFILHLPLKDNTNGYRCYSKKAAVALSRSKFISKGYILLSESALILYKKGFKFKEVKSKFTNRKSGRSNATLTEFSVAVFDLFRIRLRYS